MTQYNFPNHAVTYESASALLTTQPKRGHSPKFFDPDTMQFFSSQVDDKVIVVDDYWFFVSSEQDEHASSGSRYSKRYYVPRVMFPNGSVIGLSEMGVYRTAKAAHSALGTWIERFVKVWDEDLDWAFCTSSANPKYAPYGAVYRDVRPDPDNPKELIADLVEQKQKGIVHIAWYANQKFIQESDDA